MTLKTYQVVLEEEEIKNLDEIAKFQERSRSFMLRQGVKNVLKNTKKGEIKK